MATGSSASVRLARGDLLECVRGKSNKFWARVPYRREGVIQSLYLTTWGRRGLPPQGGRVGLTETYTNEKFREKLKEYAVTADAALMGFVVQYAPLFRDKLGLSGAEIMSMPDQLFGRHAARLDWVESFELRVATALDRKPELVDQDFAKFVTGDALLSALAGL